MISLTSGTAERFRNPFLFFPKILRCAQDDTRLQGGIRLQDNTRLQDGIRLQDNTRYVILSRRRRILFLLTLYAPVSPVSGIVILDCFDETFSVKIRP